MNAKKRGFVWWIDAGFMAFLAWKGLVFSLAGVVGMVTGEYQSPDPHDLWFVMVLAVWLAGIETMKRFERRPEGERG